MQRRRTVCTAVILSLTALFLCGCGDSRADVADAYDVYDTSAAWQLTQTDTDTTVSLMAQDLCVGGTQNTESETISSSYAEGAAVFVVEDEEITYAQNIYERLYPASTTKILTAYIALKYGNQDDVITVSYDAVNTLMSGSSICGLQEGDQLTLREALYGLLLCSGNDAANVIAEYISGSQEAFADLMNQEAAQLGATQSHFVNAHGLPDDDHYTTAYDLYLIFQAAIQNEDFVTYISSASHDASYQDAFGEPVEVTWTNTNAYLKGTYSVPDGITVVGGKTGTTDEAGSCLVLYSKNSSGKSVISVVLKGESRDALYTLMTQLLTDFAN